MASPKTGRLARLADRPTRNSSMERYLIPFIAIFLAHPLAAQSPHTVTLVPWEKTVTLPAEAAPNFRISLGTTATGWVEAIHVDAGSPVKKGDLLAEIRAPELVAARDARDAEARAAKQLVEQAKAVVESAEAFARAAGSEFARLRELAGTGTVTNKARDEAEARFESAKAKVGEATAGIASAEAGALAAAARATEAEAALAYTRIEAPYDGLVVQRRAELGDFLGSPGKGAELFVLEQTDPLRVKLYVPEHAAALTRSGQEVILQLGGRQFPAKLARVSGSLDPVTRTVLAEVDLAGSGLLPGTFGSATMTLVKLEAAALVPSNCVKTSSDGSRHVLVGNGEGEKKVPVTVHAVEGLNSVITGELVAGQTLLP